jgi:DNA repair photolyase
MIAPFLPFITNKDVEMLLEEFVRIGVDRVLVDRLNLRSNVWPSLRAALTNYRPDLIPAYVKLFFGEGDSIYYEKVKHEISEACRRLGLHCDFCY